MVSGSRRLPFRSPAAPHASYPVVRERRASGVGATGPVHPASWVGRRRPEVEAADRGLGPPESRHRAEEELLLQGGGAAVDRSADEVLVAVLEVAGGERPAGDHAR